jgi:hypothetical protein
MVLTQGYVPVSIDSIAPTAAGLNELEQVVIL